MLSIGLATAQLWALIRTERNLRIQASVHPPSCPGAITMKSRSSRTRIPAFVAALAVSLLGALSYAQITTLPIDLNTPMSFREDLAFPGYDSSNGPLRAVGLCLRWKHSRMASCENLDVQSATIDASFIPATVEISLSGTSLASLNFAPFVSQRMLPNYDGKLDYRGPSGSMDSTHQHGNQLIMIDDPALVSQFIDISDITITVEGTDTFSMSGPGNVCVQSKTRFLLGGMLIYFDA